MTKLPSLTALMDSVDERFDEKFTEDYYAPHGQGVKKLRDLTKDFLHQVILETVEVVGKEVIGKGLPEYMAGSPESHRARLRREQRARLSQLMASLKGEK